MYPFQTHSLKQEPKKEKQQTAPAEKLPEQSKAQGTSDKEKNAEQIFRPDPRVYY
jgi:hypothetical protein